MSERIHTHTNKHTHKQTHTHTHTHKCTWFCWVAKGNPGGSNHNRFHMIDLDEDHTQHAHTPSFSIYLFVCRSHSLAFSRVRRVCLCVAVCVCVRVCVHVCLCVSLLRSLSSLYLSLLSISPSHTPSKIIKQCKILHLIGR